MLNPGTERFVSPDGGRDTISIVHGCVWTLILCSWSSLHPNIPAVGESEWGVILHRTKWMFVSIIAPEYVAYQAIRGWYDADWLLKQIQLTVPSRESDPKLGELVKPGIDSIDVLPVPKLPTRTGTDEEAIVGENPDTLTEEHLVKLNQAQKRKPSIWFVRKKSASEESNDTTVYDGVTLVSSATQSRRQSSSPAPKWTAEHAYYVCMGGFHLLSEGEDGQPYRLDACQFLGLLKNGFIELPAISTEDIQVQSKSDVFAKTWALLQIFWLVAYLITRAAEHLPITTLELFTAGEVCCTLIMYVGWWKKPTDIGSSRELPTEMSWDRVEKILEEEKLKGRTNHHRVGISDHIDRHTCELKLHTCITALPIFVFGTCHLLGWQQFFPSEVERILWRVSSVVCLVLPLAIVALCHVIQKRELKKLRCGELVLILLYTVFRMYMCAEMFVGLRQVPTGVYEDKQWTRYIPHVGS